MRFGRDVISGLGLSFWSLALGLAAVPFYIYYLGIEAYGLIGFFITLQALFQFLDLGLSPAINREVAQAEASDTKDKLPDLLRSLELVFLATGLLILATILLLAQWLADDWLKPQGLSRASLVNSMMLIGITIACRWPAGLYLGVLMGAGRVTLGNKIGIAAATAGSLGAVAILAFVSPTLESFFAWQTAVGLLHVYVLRTWGWRIVGKAARRPSLAPLRGIWRFSLAMTGVAISGVLFGQLDKIILSRQLPLAQFGQYMLATTLAGMLYRIVGPVYNAVFPRFSAHVAEGDTYRLTELYRVATNALAAILFPTAMVLVVFGKALVELWTGNAELAGKTAPIIALMAIGSSLHGVMYMPYALQLAYGRTALPLKINIILMVVQVPLTVILSGRYGAVGGAGAWLGLHLLYLALGSWLTGRHLSAAAGGAWLSRDVATPLLVSAIVGAAAYFLVASVDPAPVEAVVMAAFLGVIAVAVSVWLSPHTLVRIRHTLAS